MKNTVFAFGCVASAFVLTGCNSDPNVLLGYSANQICSRHFVSGESIEFIQQRVIPEALAALPKNHAINVDTNLKQVSVTAQFEEQSITRTSLFRRGLGCTLLHDLTPAELLAQAENLDLPEELPSVPLQQAIRQDISLNKFFANNHLDYTWSDNTFAVAVLHEGKLVAEKYDAYHAGDTRMLSWSMAKTLTGLLTGVLEQQGRLALDQEVDYGAHTMSVKNLLNMSSGVKWAETPDIHGYEDLAPMWYHTGDSVEYVSKLPVQYTPGSKFEYATGTTQLLSDVVKQAAGGDIQSLNNLYQSQLFAPLGINNAIAEFDEAGNLRGGARMFLSIHDWLKIGQLFIQQGNWQGKQIVSQAWIKEVMMGSYG